MQLLPKTSKDRQQKKVAIKKALKTIDHWPGWGVALSKTEQEMLRSIIPKHSLYIYHARGMFEM